MCRPYRLALITLLLLIASPLLGQVIEEFDIPTPNAGPFWIARGPDGAMWFTMSGSRSIGRVTAAGAMTAQSTGGATPLLLTPNGDGKTLNFTIANSSEVGYVSPDGGVSILPSVGPFVIQGITGDATTALWVTTSTGRVVHLGANQILHDAVAPANGGPAPSLGAMTVASDDRIWFADQRAGAPRMGRALITGSFLFQTLTLFFVDLPADSIPVALAAGENGAVWFTDFAGYVGRVTREGVVTRRAVPHAQSEPMGITRAPDGSIWFTESGANRVGRIDPTTLELTEFEIPTADSRPAGIAADANNVIWFTERGANKIGRIGSVALPPQADLLVKMDGRFIDDNSSLLTTSTREFVVSVLNIGTEEAREVGLRVATAGDRLRFQNSSQGTCSVTDRQASCGLGTIAAGGFATARFRGDHSNIGGRPEFWDSAYVTSTPADRNPANNQTRERAYFIDCDQLVNCPLFEVLAEEICMNRTISTGAPGGKRPSSRAAGWIRTLEAVAGVDLDVFYGLRDQIFAQTAAGRRYTELYYASGLEISRLFFFNLSEGAQALQTLRTWQEPLRALVEGRGSSVTITAQQIAALQTVLDNVERLGSPELRAIIEREEAKLQLASLAGQTMDQALDRQTASAPPFVTLPAAASLHGIPPAFFHSDVRVFNPASTSVQVTARYRCFTGSCGSGVKTFSLAAGEMKVFDDMVAREFGAPESGGAIEFEGGVIVDSRLYTPEAGAPTTGMYVPALTAGSAYAEPVLLSLSHSADPSRGFRTNVGAYNPNDASLDVLFIVYDRLGREIGRTTRSLPARTPVQVNNIFAVVGAAGDFDGAYCTAVADGVRELFAYASVIDNRSQDLIFVTGKNRKRGALTTATLAAAASLHGIPPSFFHSDVTVFNPSATTPAHVTARYRCSIGACAAASTTFDVAPGEARVFEDAVVALFGASETGGAIEFTGPVVVDSRLYTPSRPAPSTGMYIPAAEEQDAHAESVLLSLSHAVDQSRGFRTNAGAYNPNPVALDVTFTLFDPTGRRLGEVIRSVPPLTPVQVNNIFAVAGITVDVPSAYCVVRADGIHPLFAFASVIDNRSQDLIFVRGSRRNGS